MKPGPVIVAAITPHRAAGHEVDIGATLDVIDYLCDAGAQGIALLGSTGEFVHLSIEERAHLVRLAAKRSRAPVLAGVTHSSFDGTVALAMGAADAGAAGILVMPPYFFRYAQAEIREFYLRLASRIGSAVPIFLYNIPVFTNPIAIQTARELLETGRFAGIKDSSGSFEDFEKLREIRNVAVLAGADSIFTRARRAGADGVISGVGCAVPELLLAMDQAIQNGGAVEPLESRLQEFLSWFDKFPVPVAIKEACAVRGLKTGALSVPLSPEKSAELDQFRCWFQSWLADVKKAVRPA
jgi:4-hydroxy-tetrahydrodipicolinate synthase